MELQDSSYSSDADKMQAADKEDIVAKQEIATTSNPPESSAKSAAPADIPQDAQFGADGSQPSSSQVEHDSEAPKVPVYYNATSRHYLVENGSGQWYEITLGQLKRKLRLKGFTGEILQDPIIDLIESQFSVDYAAPLGGRMKGFYQENGHRILVTNSPKLIEPVRGDWTMIRSLIEGLLTSAEPDHGDDQFHSFMGWMKTSVEALRNGLHQPGQVLVMAGEPDAGKSLLQHFITECLGGRSAKPARYMQGKTPFNAELFEAEHLILEDEDLDSSPKARRKLGAAFKDFTVSSDKAQSCHRKHKTAINLPVYWRVTATLNNEPQALRVLPPLEDGIQDKMVLLRASKFTMPVPFATPEEKARFWNQLQSELPAFLHFLLHEYEIPAGRKDPRFGVSTWHHPELKEALESLSDESKLLAMIDDALEPTWPQPWDGTAQDLRNIVLGEKHVTQEARKLLDTAQATGTLLGRLVKKHPERVQPHRQAKERRWRIYPPAGDDVKPNSEA